MAAQNVLYIAPFINDEFTVTSQWWHERIDPISGQITLHKGLDISTGVSKPLYSMLNGRVLSKYTDNYGALTLIICDDNVGSSTYGYATFYTHMASYEEGIEVGTRVIIGQKVGMEGTTGYSTGIHLHLMMQNVSLFNWQWYNSNNKTDYIDPTEFMGIDNIVNTHWIYNGTPYIPTHKKKAFPWVLYARKLRKKARLTYY